MMLYFPLKFDLFSRSMTFIQLSVSCFMINKSDYSWEIYSFYKPQKEKLIIYELLVRDFLESQSYNDLIDSLDYLDNIGVNAIELMTVNEFEGNTTSKEIIISMEYVIENTV